MRYNSGGTSPMKTKAFLFMMMLAATAGLAQKRPERPKIHADFHANSLPASREFSNLMAREDVRLLMVGLHQNWDLEKIAKETKLGIDDLSRLMADMEEQRLVVIVDEFETRPGPGLLIIREKEFDERKTEEKLVAHTQELVGVLHAALPEIEAMAGSLSGAKGVPKDQLMYQIVVGGLLYGAMLDTFFEDQTLLVPPPRRIGSQRYYGWLIEGDPRLAGSLKRDQWETEGHYLVSIGNTQTDRISLSQLRSDNGMVLDEADSRRLRSFLSVLSRDKLMPLFKKHRSAIFDAIRRFEAGKYSALTDVFSWYYDQLVNRAVEELVKTNKLTSPASQYTYAVKTLSR